MQNAGSLLQACEFYQEFIQSYCSPFDSIIHYDETASLASVSINLVSHTPANNVQGTENWLMLVHRLIRSITADEIRPREIWFRHQRLSPMEVYHRHFDEPVRFGMPANAIRFDRADFDKPHAESNRQLFELAAYFVRHEYRPCVTTLVSRVCDVIRKTLTSGECSSISAADRLGLLPRTLQRRLQDEGSSFGTIKDDVRRKLALQYLGQSESMTEVAAKLGYSEPSVLTRSCHRWFAASPRDIRTQLRRAGELPRSEAA
jgi:AraC-like DNA-binding protein